MQNKTFQKTNISEKQTQKKHTHQKTNGTKN